VKAKIAIAVAAFWLASWAGGALWGRLEHSRRERQDFSPMRDIKTVKYLYDAGLLDQVLDECNRIEHDERYAPYLPQVLYLRWITDRRLLKGDESSRASRDFLQKFPDHSFAADMLLELALNRLTSGDDAGGELELGLIVSRYPSTKAAEYAKSALGYLQDDSSVQN
jgi:hypothetical protein